MDQSPLSPNPDEYLGWEEEPTQRQQRQFEFGHELSDLSDLEDSNWDNEEFRHKLGNYLERQNWGDVVNNIQAGDQVIFFSSPAIEMLKIKYLNDVIFGPQVTDDIIGRKRILLRSKFEELAQDLGIDDLDALVLIQDFKQDVFRVPVGTNLDKQKLNNICEEVNQAMVNFIKEKLAQMEDSDGLSLAQQEFAQHLETGGGYRLTYGTEVVNNENINLKDKILTLQRTYATSTIARTGVEDGGYGIEYNSETIINELNRIKSLKLKLKDRSIIDSDGITYSVFSSDGFLDRDLLRLIRKEKFRCPSEQRELFDLIKKYIKSINLVDLLKPFTYSELENGNLAIQIDVNNRLAQKLKSSEELDQVEKEAIIMRVQSDAKDRNYTSADVFHAQASNQFHTSYIAIDVLDVGLDQIRECEELINSLSNIDDQQEKIQAFEEVALKAGDKTTEYLREIRQIIANTIMEDFSSEDKPILALVGGDELTLAIENRPNDREHEQKINDLQFKIKKNLQKKLRQGAEVRMIRTAMARTNKDMDTDKITDSDMLVKAHRDALKRSEQGIEIAKKIEELERKIKNNLTYKAIIMKEIDESFKPIIEMMLRSSSDFIVKENEENMGDFNIIDEQGIVIPYTHTLNLFVIEQLK